MYGELERSRALELRSAGLSLAAIAQSLGVARSTVRALLDPERGQRQPSRCFACGEWACPCPEDYLYLLGQYLGDGYLVTSVRVPRVRISCCTEYPGIAARVDAALAAVSGNRPGFVTCIGCTDRFAYWMHWPCVLPQHGPGRKHERRIELVDWQAELVKAYPWPFIRGLIHSDGCRSINRITAHGRSYAYPRYFFANESRDILAIMGWALDLVGVPWRYNRPNSISIARRAAVAMLDEHIGPKS